MPHHLHGMEASEWYLEAQGHRLNQEDLDALEDPSHQDLLWDLGDLAILGYQEYLLGRGLLGVLL